VRRGPTIQTKMSLATAEIDCTVSPPLSGAMEDCSIARGPQLQRLCRQNCCMSGQWRMFGSLWSIVVLLGAEYKFTLLLLLYDDYSQQKW